MTADTVPVVGIVVVNWHGEDLTLACLSSLDGLTWPADRLVVALVDNGSAPGFLARVAAKHPTVRVVEAGRNVGFGGACNLGFEALADCDHIAVLNNDAVPDHGWLEPLVDILENEPAIGAATPKVLLNGLFVTVELRSPTARPGGGDPRSLGVQLCGARVNGVDVSAGIELFSGFWGWEHDATSVGGDFAWTDGVGIAHIPVLVDSDRVRVELRLACGTRDVDLKIISGDDITVAAVGVQPVWTSLGGTVRPLSLVNNVGIVLRDDGSSADRGYLEPDDGRFDEPADVFGWSGAVVLLSRRYLDDVGGFDDRLFLYYEDVDLSWRGRLRGWTYRYEPTSVVHHERSATIGSRSGLARHLADRNRLVVLVKCAPRNVMSAAVCSTVRELVEAVHRDVVRRVASRQRPLPEHAIRRARTLAAFLRLLPHALRERRKIHRRALCDVDVHTHAEAGIAKDQLRISRRRRP